MRRFPGTELQQAALRCAIGGALLTMASGALAAGRDDIDSGILIEKGRPGLEQAMGFVVDRTITHFGGEFVRFYSEAWREQAGTESIDVTIVERPSARWGSVIFIEHNNRPVARVFLYAGRSATIKPLAVQAARYVAGQVSDQALARLLMSDPDLGKDELMK